MFRSTRGPFLIVLEPGHCSASSIVGFAFDARVSTSFATCTYRPPRAHTCETSYLSPFFFFFLFFRCSFLSCLCEELVSHWSRQCLSCKPPSVVALPWCSPFGSLGFNKNINFHGPFPLPRSRWAKSPKCIFGAWIQQCHNQQKMGMTTCRSFPHPTFLIEMVGNDEERKGTTYQNRYLSEILTLFLLLWHHDLEPTLNIRLHDIFSPRVQVLP